MERVEISAALTAVLQDALGDASAEIRDLEQLTGGASRQTWAFDLVDEREVARPLILRRDPPALARPEGMALEAAAIRGADDQGVAVPGVLASGDGSDGVGAPYIVMERVEGETLARRILRDATFDEVRPRLAAQCGRMLARIHRVPTETLWTEPEVDPLGPVRAQLDDYLGVGIGQPALELGLRWLEETQPPLGELAVVHGDFRHGNLMIGPDGIRAVLDWERVHIGDPMEDLGWLCVKTWRFGSPKPVGGFGEYEELFAAYEQESGRKLDPAVVRWWELYGTVRWGMGCISMAQRHREGHTRSVELAAIGRRACENEHDLLLIIDQMMSEQ